MTTEEYFNILRKERTRNKGAIIITTRLAPDPKEEEKWEKALAWAKKKTI